MKKNGQYVGVDEKYVPEEERYVEGDSKKDAKILKGVGIGYLAVIIFIFIIVIIGFVVIIMNFVDINNNRKNNTQVNDNEIFDLIIEDYNN